MNGAILRLADEERQGGKEEGERGTDISTHLDR